MCFQCEHVQCEDQCDHTKWGKCRVLVKPVAQQRKVLLSLTVLDGSGTFAWGHHLNQFMVGIVTHTSWDRRTAGRALVFSWGAHTRMISSAAQRFKISLASWDDTSPVFFTMLEMCAKHEKPCWHSGLSCQSCSVRPNLPPLCNSPLRAPVLPFSMSLGKPV